jgi:hypothetical protein
MSDSFTSDVGLLPTPLLPDPYPLIPTPYSLFPVPCSLLPIPCSLLLRIPPDRHHEVSCLPVSHILQRMLRPERHIQHPTRPHRIRHHLALRFLPLKLNLACPHHDELRMLNHMHRVRCRSRRLHRLVQIHRLARLQRAVHHIAALSAVGHRPGMHCTERKRLRSSQYHPGLCRGRRSRRTRCCSRLSKCFTCGSKRRQGEADFAARCSFHASHLSPYAAQVTPTPVSATVAHTFAPIAFFPCRYSSFSFMPLPAVP